MRIYYGPPGTGKTLAAVRDAIAHADPGWAPSDPQKAPEQSFEHFWELGDRLEFVTFSPGDQYETVVEAIRPHLEVNDDPSTDQDRVGATGNHAVRSLGYHYWVGPVLRLIRRATEHPQEEHVLVIDEINRADISQVMGPLIAAIEADKRLGGPFPIPFNVRYDREASKEWIPANLHVVATMNSADRNLALVDIALRRRFEFVRVNTEDALVPSSTTDDVDRLNPRLLLRALNERIAQLLGEDFEIGHSYLMSASTSSEVIQVMATKILPLLEEYFYGDDTALLLVVGEHPDDQVAPDRIFDLITNEPEALGRIFGEPAAQAANAHIAGTAGSSPYRRRLRRDFWDTRAQPPGPGDLTSAVKALRKIYRDLKPGADEGASEGAAPTNSPSRLAGEGDHVEEGGDANSSTVDRPSLTSAGSVSPDTQ
jgi:5-methylcytosine-specific restriction protein B